MLWVTVGLAAQGAELFHLLVHRLEGVDAPFVEHLPEGDAHIAHGSGIVTGPVVVKRRQVQMLRHDVQLVLAKVRQQVLGQDKGIHIGRVKVQAHLFEAPSAVARP